MQHFSRLDPVLQAFFSAMNPGWLDVSVKQILFMFSWDDATPRKMVDSTIIIDITTWWLGNNLTPENIERFDSHIRVGSLMHPHEIVQLYSDYPENSIYLNGDVTAEFSFDAMSAGEWIVRNEKTFRLALARLAKENYEQQS